MKLLSIKTSTCLSFILLTVATLETKVDAAFLSSPRSNNVVGRSMPSGLTSSLTNKQNHVMSMMTSGDEKKIGGERQKNMMKENIISKSTKVASIIAASFILSATTIMTPPSLAGDMGASLAGNAKITTGGASTLQSGRTIAITRGVNLDNSNFAGQNLRGVAFQQSIVRDTNFKGTNLVGSSFFDATVDGSDFEGADMTLANVEMAQFNRANLKVSSATM